VPLPGPDEGDEAVRRWLSRVGPELLTAAARVDLAYARGSEEAGCAADAVGVVRAWRRARRVLATRPPLREGDLAVSGRDLIAAGLQPGPRFGALLGDLLDFVLEDPSRNRKDELLRRLYERLEEGEGDGRA